LHTGHEVPVWHLSFAQRTLLGFGFLAVRGERMCYDSSVPHTRFFGNACDAALLREGVAEVPLSPETWEKLQYLARLELTPEEKVRMERELGELLAYVSSLRQLPLDGVSPMILPVEVEPVLRADVPEVFPSREELLRNAPEVQDGAFVVPNVLEE